MDPFTQKLLERTKARKEYVEAKFAKTPQPLPRKRRSPLKEENGSMALSSLTSTPSDNKDDDSPGKRQCVESSNSHSESSNAESVKENAAINCSQAPIVDEGIKNRLKALAQFHSGNANEPTYGTSEAGQTILSKTRNDESSLQPVVSYNTSTPQKRTGRFAALAASINMWEDDLQNGTFKQNPRPLKESNSTPPVSSSEGSSLSSSGSFKTPSSDSSVPPPPPPLVESEPCTSTSPTRSTPRLVLSPPQQGESPKSKVVRSSSAASNANPAPTKRRSSSFTSPPKLKPITCDSAPSTAKQQKTKNVVWDQAIVATLQAQGFVQSPSKSKLEYQFRESDKSATSVGKGILKKREQTQKGDIKNEDDQRPVTPPVASSSPEGVIEPPKKSVRELAKMFKGVVTPPVPKPPKDPTELPLAARVAIFEKEASNSKFTSSAKTITTPVVVPVNKTVEPQSVVHATSPKAKPLQLTSPTAVTTTHSESPASNSSVTSPTSPSKVGHHTFQLHRQLFEHMQDWKQNEISAKLKEDRQKDMEVVLNRWSYKNKLAAMNAAASVAPTVQEFKGLNSSGNEQLQQQKSSQSTVKLSKVIPEPPPLPTEPCVGPASKTTPRKQTVQFETTLSDEDSNSSKSESPNESVTDQADDSYESTAGDRSIGGEDGSDCIDGVGGDTEEDNEEYEVRKATRIIDDLLTEDESNVSSDSDKGPKLIPLEDHSLDSSIVKEAFIKVSPLMTKPPENFVAPELYVAPKAYKYPEGSSVTSNRERLENDENDAPILMHTVSFYRRQKEAARLTPVRIVHHQDVCSSKSPEKLNEVERSVEESLSIQEKIKQLQEVVVGQQTIIAQTSQALNLCRSTTEFHGSAQQIEGERLLLIATHKRMACLNEIQRLKTEVGTGSHIQSKSSKGSLSISELKLPLKKEFLQQTAFGKEGDFVHFFLCLVKHRALVIATQMVSTIDNIENGTFNIPNLINIRELERDFNVVIEVYGLQTKRENVTKEQKTLANKKEKSKLTLTPKKRQSKRDLRMTSPAVQSPGGPSAVCTSSFALVGFATVNIKSLQRKSWVLEKCPYVSPLEGNLFMKVQCHSDFSAEEQGFLTMFEDVGGFGAWHRRWFALSTRYLSYWKYPDDVKRKEPMGRIDLCQCVTSQVSLVARDICARPNTFMLLLVKPPSQDDVDSLVVQSHSSYTSIKILLSADTKEERICWCQNLNKSLENIRAWDPNALHPIPSDSI